MDKTIRDIYIELLLNEYELGDDYALVWDSKLPFEPTTWPQDELYIKYGIK